MVSAQRKRLPITDIYGITHSPASGGRSTIETVRLMLEAGIRIIQYREKSLPVRQMLAECLAIRRLCSEHGASFIVNDRPDLALLADADGIHLGQDDLPLPEVRKLVGETMLIGLSTHSPEQARQAMEVGADYIGVGPIFHTRTKTDACAPVGLDCLDYACQHITIPKIAIGGIKAHNLHQVGSRRPDLICLVTEITDAPDIPAKVNELRAILKSQQDSRR